MSKTAKITDWIFELFHLHLHFQWIIYTIRGFVISGLFPSTASIFADIRHWLLKGRTEMLTKFLDDLTATIKGYLQKYETSGIAISLPGFVNVETGYTEDADNFFFRQVKIG
ncbi:DUF624 domain-containing protein [Pseudogracilibacillus sp. SO30301A]|uniref:DUF624 domain-containing protein n=1 Tax=Pseudogracilibacillus sp. SO30301A TaxID=3098291 RepID=UPI00300DE9F9